MTATPINGNELAITLREGISTRVAQLCKKGHRPGLIVILVGEDPASQATCAIR